MPEKLQKLIENYNELRREIMERARVVEAAHPNLYAGKFSRQLVELMDMGLSKVERRMSLSFTKAEKSLENRLAEQSDFIDERFNEQSALSDEIKNLLGAICQKLEVTNGREPGP